MGVKVTVSRYGFVAFRIFWRGRRYEFGTKARADEDTLRFFHAKAVLIGADLERGRPLHLALIEHLGDCPPKLVPGYEKKQRRAILTFDEYFETWLARKTPEVSVSTAKRYRRSWRGVLLPLIGAKIMREFDVADLRELRQQLGEPYERTSPKGKRQVVRRKSRTLRNIIDWHLKALWNDALIDEVVSHNPFPKLKWKKQRREAKPDPFEAGEREKILAWYRKHDRFWYPFVAWQFWTGMRPGETAALRYGDVDLERGHVWITKSRDEGEEGPPKTGERDIDVMPQALEALASRPAPHFVDDETYLFLSPEKKNVTDSWWPKRGWYRCLRACGIRPRKFYATRHTFISAALAAGDTPSEVADYCGTSVTMIERHYGRWIQRRKSLAGLRAANPKPARRQRERKGS